MIDLDWLEDVTFSFDTAMTPYYAGEEVLR
jgi:hypothetical protein